MKIVLCLDDKNGMMFNKRRQSKDRILREKVSALAAGAGASLWMSEYSARQFTENGNITVDNDCISKASGGDYCFVEDCTVTPTELLERCDELILFKWNRQYPADIFFDADIEASGFVLSQTEEFAGSSHEKITMETYSKV